MLQQRVDSFLAGARLADGPLVVAVSGGPDSITLLHLLTGWARTYGRVLHVFHMDHGLRGDESATDARFVLEQAAALGWSATLVGLAPGELDRMGGSTQEAARSRRYDELVRLAHRLGAAGIATGHNQDDQAETVLMRFLRGAGAHGLAGIAAITVRAGIPLLRPLLEVPRSAIEAYCRQFGLAFRIDSSNLHTDYLRNQLRQELLPHLAETYNPAIRRTLSQMATVLREEDLWLDELASAQLQAARLPSAANQVELTVEALTRVPVPLQRRIVRLAVQELNGSGEGCSLASVERVLDLLTRSGGARQVPLGPRLWALREYDRLRIAREESLGEWGGGEWPLALAGPQAIPELNLVVEVGHGDGPGRPLAPHERLAVFDAGLLPGPLAVRTRRPGDRLYPVGMTGSKKLQDILVDAKVPRRLRDRLPLIAAGDELLWLLPDRLDRRFQTSEQTVEKLWISVK
ncbi:MAG TPA: tRNA lysidine(34) synthetase TilS [Symbiobacteriaceae bacterium]|nr:tRNA lysidine(34) synthetase TilS [Symbiobacteriaceae bacterium]